MEIYRGFDLSRLEELLIKEINNSTVNRTTSYNPETVRIETDHLVILNKEDYARMSRVYESALKFAELTRRN